MFRWVPVGIGWGGNLLQAHPRQQQQQPRKRKIQRKAQNRRSQKKSQINEFPKIKNPCFSIASLPGCIAVFDYCRSRRSTLPTRVSPESPPVWGPFLQRRPGGLRAKSNLPLFPCRPASLQRKKQFSLRRLHLACIGSLHWRTVLPRSTVQCIDSPQPSINHPTKRSPTRFRLLSVFHVLLTTTPTHRAGQCAAVLLFLQIPASHARWCLDGFGRSGWPLQSCVSKTLFVCMLVHVAAPLRSISDEGTGKVAWGWMPETRRYGNIFALYRTGYVLKSKRAFCPPLPPALSVQVSMAWLVYIVDGSRLSVSRQLPSSSIQRTHHQFHPMPRVQPSLTKCAGFGFCFGVLVETTTGTSSLVHFRFRLRARRVGIGPTSHIRLGDVGLRTGCKRWRAQAG